MTPDEEADYVRDVAAAKTAVLRMSVDAADRLAMPFVGETPAAPSGDVQSRKTSFVRSSRSKS
jgi:hypothetical protein